MVGFVLVYALGDIGNANVIGILRWRRVEPNDLAGGMGAKFGGIDANVTTALQRIFLDLEYIQDRVGVEPWHGTVEVGQIRIVVKVGFKIAM